MKDDGGHDSLAVAELQLHFYKGWQSMFLKGRKKKEMWVRRFSAPCGMTQLGCHQRIELFFIQEHTAFAICINFFFLTKAKTTSIE